MGVALVQYEHDCLRLWVVDTDQRRVLAMAAKGWRRAARHTALGGRLAVTLCYARPRPGVAVGDAPDEAASGKGLNGDEAVR